MLEQIVNFLKNANIKQAAKEAGLSYPTVLNIKNGKNLHPNLRTIEKLSKFIWLFQKSKTQCEYKIFFIHKEG